MYVYVYDDFLNRNKYNKVTNKIETRLTDLGLNGKIIRLDGIKNIKGTIQNEIRLGAKTIVAVGNNQTVNKIIGAIIEADIYDDFQKNTLLGIIPVGGDNSIAHSLGIKNESLACNIILARRIEKIDLGLANDYYFLNEASIESLGTSISLPGYTLDFEKKGDLKIINLLSTVDNPINSNPHDGFLDIFLDHKKDDKTLLRLNNFIIENNKYPLILDGVFKLETPAQISVKKNLLKVIVGKDRSFI